MWSPPDNPDPSEILREAVADGRAGRYEVALEKFLWFHENALAIESGLAGVRLSFALDYWLILAEDYPPALAAFRRVRDETEKALREEPDSFHLFLDIRSMNAQLGEGLGSADLFQSIAVTNPVAAKEIYRLAESELIRAGRFQICNAFLEPEARIERASQCYQGAKRYAKTHPMPEDADIETHQRHFYVSNTATLVGLLVINGREDEAIVARNLALKDIDDAEFRTILDAALAGHLPEQLY